MACFWRNLINTTCTEVTALVGDFLFTFGFNASGQLGLGDNLQRDTAQATSVEALDFSVSDVASVYIDSTGDLYGVGSGNQYRLVPAVADGSTSNTFQLMGSGYTNVDNKAGFVVMIDSNGDLSMVGEF